MKKSVIIISLMITALLSIFVNAQTDTSAAFDDVPEDAWYKSAVDTVVEKGLMNGVGEKEFAPDDLTTRATIVTILWRMNGSPVPADTAPFSDLTQEWYKGAIDWAYKNGIVNGVSDTSFAPDTALSRDGIVTILYRFYFTNGGKPVEIADLSAYSDADGISTWAKDAFSWAVSCGIVGGSDGKLRPADSVSRAELAAMIVRFYNKYVYFFEQTDNPDEDELYKKIVCASTGGYSETGFGMPEFGYLLNLRHPKEWTFS